MTDTTQEKINKMLRMASDVLEAGKNKTYNVSVAGTSYEVTIMETPKKEESKDCCTKCKYLKVLNTGKVYAFCKKINKVFLPFGVDTKKYCCKNFNGADDK